MTQLTIVGPDGKAVKLQELNTVLELNEVVNWAKTVIQECERLIKAKSPKKSSLPYLS